MDLDFLFKNIPSWSVGIAFLLVVIHDLFSSVSSKDPTEKLASQTQRLLNILQEVENKTGADRVTLLQAHDSGKAISLETPWFSSTVLSITDHHDLRDLAERWTSQPLDTHYKMMLMDLASRKQFVVREKNLPKSILKNLYAHDGIQTSFIVEVMMLQKRRSILPLKFLGKKELIRYFYISANFKGEVPEFSNISEDLRAAASKINSLLKE